MRWTRTDRPPRYHGRNKGRVESTSEAGRFGASTTRSGAGPTRPLTCTRQPGEGRHVRRKQAQSGEREEAAVKECESHFERPPVVDRTVSATTSRAVCMPPSHASHGMDTVRLSGIQAQTQQHNSNRAHTYNTSQHRPIPPPTHRSQSPAPRSQRPRQGHPTSQSSTGSSNGPRTTPPSKSPRSRRTAGPSLHACARPARCASGAANTADRNGVACRTPSCSGNSPK